MRSTYDPKSKTLSTRVEKKFVDLETGEILSVAGTSKTKYGNSRYYRANKNEFFKALQALDATSMKVALYIIGTADYYNSVEATYVTLQEKFEVSNKTIAKAMVSLQEHDVIRMVHPAKWMFNPSLAVSCYEEDVEALIEKYNKLTPYSVRRGSKNKEQGGSENAD